MNKNFIKLLSVCLICMVCFLSCERYPIRTLLGLPDNIDSWPDPWYIYDNEINTKGSLEPFRWQDDPTCAGWDKVKLDFACTTNPEKMAENVFLFIGREMLMILERVSSVLAYRQEKI